MKKIIAFTLIFLVSCATFVQPPTPTPVPATPTQSTTPTLTVIPTATSFPIEYQFWRGASVWCIQAYDKERCPDVLAKIHFPKLPDGISSTEAFYFGAEFACVATGVATLLDCAQRAAILREDNGEQYKVTPFPTPKTEEQG